MNLHSIRQRIIRRAGDQARVISSDFQRDLGLDIGTILTLRRINGEDPALFTGMRPDDLVMEGEDPEFHEEDISYGFDFTRTDPDGPDILQNETFFYNEFEWI
jgi:hypothetical protein